jgi:hypothetical protein
MLRMDGQNSVCEKQNTHRVSFYTAIINGNLDQFLISRTWHTKCIGL